MPEQTQRGRGGTDPTFSQAGARGERVVSTTLRPHYPQGNSSSDSTGDWVDLGAGLNGTENLAPTETRSPGREAGVSPYTDYGYPGCHYS